jgi:hypothetical protein
MIMSNQAARPHRKRQSKQLRDHTVPATRPDGFEWHEKELPILKNWVYKLNRMPEEHYETTLADSKKKQFLRSNDWVEVVPGLWTKGLWTVRKTAEAANTIHQMNQMFRDRYRELNS